MKKIENFIDRPNEGSPVIISVIKAVPAKLGNFWKSF